MKIKGTKTYMWMRYILINGVFAALIYFGLIGGNDALGTIALLIGWAMGIVALFMLLAIIIDGRDDNSNRGKYKKFIIANNTKIVPYRIDLAFDLFAVAAFIYTGYYWLTIFYIVHMISVAKIHHLIATYRAAQE